MLTKLEGFGLNDDKADKEFPTLAQLQNFPQNSDIKLQKISYKLNEGNKSLAAIQLGFTNGV